MQVNARANKQWENRSTGLSKSSFNYYKFASASQGERLIMTTAIKSFLKKTPSIVKELKLELERNNYNKAISKIKLIRFYSAAVGLNSLDALLQKLFESCLGTELNSINDSALALDKEFRKTVYRLRELLTNC